MERAIPNSGFDGYVMVSLKGTVKRTGSKGKGHTRHLIDSHIQPPFPVVLSANLLGRACGLTESSFRVESLLHQLKSRCQYRKEERDVIFLHCHSLPQASSRSLVGGPRYMLGSSNLFWKSYSIYSTASRAGAKRYEKSYHAMVSLLTPG